MLAITVERKFVRAGPWDRQMFQTQVNVSVAESRNAVCADRLMLDLRPHHRRSFDTAQFDRERVLALRVASDQREKPERRQHGAEIADQEAIEKPHQTELAGLLFSNVIAQGSKE